MLARPGLPGFEYVKAGAPDEVTRLIQQHGANARLLMGGTDLFARMRNGEIRPRVVVDVKHLPGICDVVFDAGTGLTVGAAVTMNQLVRQPDVQTHYPLLAESANAVASYPLRNRATMGGNLCNASPCADTAPAALVLDGQIVLFGPRGERRVAVKDFFAGPGETAIGAGEFMTALQLPLPPAGGVGTYLKLGRNKAGDLALVGVAVFGYRDTTASSGYRFRIALASVAPVPLCACEAEEVLVTNSINEDTFLLAARKTAEATTPIDDVRASAIYRKAMVQTLTLRGLRNVWQSLHDPQHVGGG
jgi:CO/xanthine dehydrogenase FAD-binding subunit